MRRTAIVAAFIVAAATASEAGIPACLSGYVGKLRRVLDKAEAERFFRIVDAWSPEAQRGTRAFLDSTDDAEGLYDTIFDTLERRYPPNSPANPFDSDESLLETIGDLAEAGEGFQLEKVIQALNRHEDDAGVLRSQGAIFDLYVARQVPNKTGLKFQYALTVGDGSRNRVPDMFEPRAGCPDACGGLPGRLNENKNWTILNPDDVVDNPVPNQNGGFRYSDPEGKDKLSQLADEFARDIVLLSSEGVGFDFYRLNVNGAVRSPAQANAIRKLLRKQFESAYVSRQLTPARLAALIEEFDEKVGTFVRFLP